MKLRKILNENYSVEDMFDLSKTTNIDDLKMNIGKILYELADRKMGFIYVQNYLKIYPQISKQFLNELEIENLSDFEKYIYKLHTKVRTGIKQKKLIDKQNSAFRMFMYKIFSETGAWLDD